MKTDNEKFLADHRVSTAFQHHHPHARPATGDPEGSGNFRHTRRLSDIECEELAELLTLIADAPHFATDEAIERTNVLLDKAGE